MPNGRVDRRNHFVSILMLASSLLRRIAYEKLCFRHYILILGLPRSGIPKMHAAPGNDWPCAVVSLAGIAIGLR